MELLYWIAYPGKWLALTIVAMIVLSVIWSTLTRQFKRTDASVVAPLVILQVILFLIAVTLLILLILRHIKV